MRFSLALALIAFTALSGTAQAEITYTPTGFVNDYAQVMPADERTRIEEMLQQYQQTTSIEIAVVTIPSLQGLEVEDYATTLFNQWGVGKKGKDTGILLLVAPNDRSTRIEVGYGLEPDLTDLQAGRILDAMLPYFREQRYSKGIELGVVHIISTLGTTPLTQREADRAAAAERQRANNAKALIAVGGIAGFGVTGLFMGMFLRRRRERAELIKSNVSIATTLDAAIKAADLANQYSTDVVEHLKTQYARSAWEDLVPIGSSKALQQELQEILIDQRDSLESLRHTNRSLTNLGVKLGSYAKFPSFVDRRIKDIERAKTETPVLFRDQPAMLAGLAASAEHPDVTPATRQSVADLNALFMKMVSSHGAPGLPDYLSVHRTLEGVGSNIVAIGDTIIKEKAYAIKARTEGPALYASIPGKVAEAEKHLAHTDVSETAKEDLDRAKRKFAVARQIHDQQPTDWVHTFTLLNEVCTLFASAITKATSDKEEAARRRRRSSSSYSSSSSSSSFGSSGSRSSSSRSFGGFGGGRSGGAGASRRW